ncbi:transposase [Streptomyces sp. NPDC001774]
MRILTEYPEALLPQLYAPAPAHFNSSGLSCDCLAHVYGNAADHPARKPHYPSDMSDEERAAVRPLLPVPAWLEGRGGQPESYCHRQMLDAIRYLVAGGISWRSMPVDFPAWARVYAFFRRWRENELIGSTTGCGRTFESGKAARRNPARGSSTRSR